MTNTKLPCIYRAGCNNEANCQRAGHCTSAVADAMDFAEGKIAAPQRTSKDVTKLIEKVSARIPSSVTPSTRIEIHPSEWLMLADAVSAPEPRARPEFKRYDFDRERACGFREKEHGDFVSWHDVQRWLDTASSQPPGSDDAERYRFLRDKAIRGCDLEAFVACGQADAMPSEARFDAWIDAARATSRSGGDHE